MAFTLKLLLKLIKNLFWFGFFIGFIYMQYWAFYPAESSLAKEKMCSNIILAGLLDIVILSFFIMHLIIEGTLNNWWYNINQFLIKKVDPLTISLCDFINRRNCGCKEE